MSPDTYIAAMSAHFAAGRYDQLTPRFAFPIPVYVNNSTAILANPGQIWSFFESLHCCFVTAGLPQLSGKVASIELPRDGRFRMWVDWVATGANGARHAMRTVSYNRGTHADCKIEMIELMLDKKIAAATWQNAA